MLNLAVDLDMALVLSLAVKSKWELRVRPRAPEAPAAKVDYKKRLKQLQELCEVAPAPRVKG